MSRLLPVLLAALALPVMADGARVGTFDVVHQIDVEIPEGAHSVRIWIALPMEVEAQSVANVSIEAPGIPTVATDRRGNRYLHVELIDPSPGSVRIVTRFRLTRRQVTTDVDPARTRPLTDAERAAMGPYLRPSTHVVVTDEIRALAAEIVGDATNPVVAARRIYDWVLANIDYWVKDPAHKKASKVGSTEYCLAERTGNCTDFHSLWTSLARGAGIPSRMKYGSLFKPTLDGVEKDASYHCWPEFWAPGIGWVPLDVAVADIYDGPLALDDANRNLVELTTATGYAGPDAARVDFYFGNLDERRVTWTVGRDLILAPVQETGPVNAFPKAHVEIDGAIHGAWTRRLTYRGVE